MHIIVIALLLVASALGKVRKPVQPAPDGHAQTSGPAAASTPFGSVSSSCFNGGFSIRPVGSGNGVLTHAVPMHLLFYGPFQASDITYVQTFVQNIAPSTWWNGVSNSYYTHAGVYASDRVYLAGSYQINPLDFPTYGYELNYNFPGFGLDNAGATTGAVVLGLVKAILGNLTVTIDSNAIYFLVMSPLVLATDNYACGWHSYNSASAMQYGVLYPVGPGCYDVNPGLSGESSYLQAIASVLAHETAESVTDFDVSNGWYSNSGGENGDFCSQCFGDNAVAVNNTFYNLQYGTQPAYLYFVQDILDTRTGKCQNAAAANIPGQVTCTRATSKTCTKTAGCAPSGTTCIAGFCTCPPSSCLVNGKCLTFPTPASSCPAVVSSDPNLVSITATPVHTWVAVSCRNGFVPSRASIYCMENGLWDVVPSCGNSSVTFASVPFSMTSLPVSQRGVVVVAGHSSITTGGPNRAGWRVNTLVNAKDLPVISYGNVFAYQAVVTLCASPNCTASATQQFPYAAVSVARLQSNGAPVVLVNEQGYIQFLVCADGLTCSTFQSTQTLNAGLALQDFVLDASNSPVAALFSGLGDKLTFLRCNTATCGTYSSKTLFTASLSANSAYGGGESPTIALKKRDNTPTIVFANRFGARLTVISCRTATCTSFGTTQIDTATSVGPAVSMVLDASDFPVISYYDRTAKALKIAHCVDIACASAPTISVVDHGADVGSFSSIAYTSATFAVVSYIDKTNHAIKLARCQNAACSAASISVVDTATGAQSSVALKSDGNAVVSYFDLVTGNLKLANCLDAACATLAV